MTLKVVGASPIIYLILNISTKVDVCSSRAPAATAPSNPTYAAAWVYSGEESPAATLANHLAASDTAKFFTNNSNLNKLFLWASTGFFISPGIALSHYSDPDAKHLSKRPKTWVYSITALKVVSKRTWVLEFGDLYGRKEFLLRSVVVQNIPFSWVFFHAKYLNTGCAVKPNSRIKNWVKKKYFSLNSQAM